MNLIDLPFIAQEAIERENENMAFRTFLKSKDGKQVDRKMQPIAAHYTESIDCTKCGNCCKNIMISVDEKEVSIIARALNEDTVACKQKYFESSNESDAILISAIPCHFLKNNKCAIYQSRPSACASFPHVELPDFTSRLYSMIDGYGVCPIIYHCMEELKSEYRFRH